jgi:hypothetical protein
MNPTEKQLVNRVSTIPLEEVYTELDILPGPRDAGFGYRFDFPPLWLNEFGENKVISVRKLQVIPSLDVFQFKVEIQNGPHLPRQFFYNVIESTNLEEWLCQFMNDFNTSEQHVMTYLYDYRTGFLDFSMFDRTYGLPIHFKFVFENDNHIPFLQFLNQDVANFPDDFVQSYSFTGVWNRARIMFHANFSTSKRNYFGCSGDHWPKPSKVYKFNSGISTFNIWFTTDGYNRILPKYASLLMELVFISNFKTVDPVL